MAASLCACDRRCVPSFLPSYASSSSSSSHRLLPSRSLSACRHRRFFFFLLGYPPPPLFARLTSDKEVEEGKGRIRSRRWTSLLSQNAMFPSSNTLSTSETAVSNQAVFGKKDQYDEDDGNASDDDDDDDDDEDEIVDDVMLEEFFELEDSEEEGEIEEEEREDALSGDEFAVDRKAEMRQKVHELRNRKREDPEFQITSGDLSALYDFRIDKFQRLAIQGFLNGSSVVVCAPTSSGKTLIAECAAAASFAMQKRVFYTTPLKALSNQKFREFRDIFGEENVGILTGDAAVNRDASILIMTTEILRNMLYQIIGTYKEGDQLHNVSAIVLDEVHYLSDTSRGTVWEETVIYCPKNVQLICLSATVANAEELAGWIGQVHGPTELVTSRRRPVPLSWHFSTRYSLSPLLNDEATEMNRRLSLARYLPDEGGGRSYNAYNTGFNSYTDQGSGKGQRSKVIKSRQRRSGEIVKPATLSEDEMQFLRRRQVPRVEETLKQLKYKGMLPAIWFIFSRKGCDTAAQYVQNIQLLSEDEQQQVSKALTNFRKEHPDAVRESSISSLLCGFASHHAGCLPLWKTFIEELFQKGLVKVVFATETLAAGINMPARSTVLSSLSKRGDTGHELLSSNSMLQMAGRAGRRGLDERGHVVLVQTPFEGAEEACKLLFAGPDPLVSQFAASYGMVLNLLSSMRSPDGKVLRKGRTLEEARALIEQSFGNYVGSQVKVEALEEIERLDDRIAQLQNMEIADVKNVVSEEEIKEYMVLKEKIKAEKDILKVLQNQSDQKKVLLLQPVLQDALGKNEYLTLSLSYVDFHSGNETTISVMCIGLLTNPSFLRQGALVDPNSHEDVENSSVDETQLNEKDPLFLGLGSDNFWYAFSATAVHNIFHSVVSDAFKESVRDILTHKLPSQMEPWEMVGKSGKGDLTHIWALNGSLDTWSWSMNIPTENETESSLMPEEVINAVKTHREQRRKVARIRKEIKATRASKEYWNMVGQTKLRDAKIAKLKAKRSKLAARVNEMQPTGWQEFLQVVKVLEEVDAIMPQTHEMLPLGRAAASLRGVNELWLAMAFSETYLNKLNPAQFASVCATFVSEGVKIRPQMGASDIYRPSGDVEKVIDLLREKRKWLYDVQNKHKVMIPCELEDQLAGLVEAWASGVTWKELMMGCNMDEGDLARLLRRTIDLLAQVPSVPNADPLLCKTAATAADVMDRSPISELIT